MPERKLPVGISGSTLKLIAIITMFIDHTGATVLRAILNHPSFMNRFLNRGSWIEIYTLSRKIGRLAFPIFCFLLVEGFLHTRNVRKYSFRLFLFALISEIPFDIALKGSWYFPQKQNVYFTLLIGLLVLIGFSYCEQLPKKFLTSSEKESRFPARLAAAVPAVILALCILHTGMEFAKWLDTDYSYKGVFLIAVLYLLRRFRLLQCAAGAAAVTWELPAPIAFLPILFYNGTRGRQMKYFFYWFYPIHLLFLYAAAHYLIPLF